MDRIQLVAAGAAIIVAAVAGVIFGRPPEPPPLPTPTSQPVRLMTVHVSGLVANPGLVELPTGSRVADAVSAAGGLIPGTDAGSVNLAAHLVDGQHVVVGPHPGPAGSSQPGGRVPLNTATAAALEEVPGLGPVLAGRIIAYREANGPFAAVEDLLDVGGIGEGKLAAIRDYLVVP